MVKKPRSWGEIIQQEGAIGLLKGEDIKIEHDYQRAVRLGQIKINNRIGGK